MRSTVPKPCYARACTLLWMLAFTTLHPVSAQPYTSDPTFITGSGFLTPFGPGRLFDVELDGQGRIYVAGDFTQYNGNTRRGLIRLLGDGSIDPTYSSGPGASDGCSAIGFQSDGKLIVGGRFTSFNGQSTSTLIRLDLNGNVDPAFVANVGWEINDLVVLPDDRILACGRPLNTNTNRFVVRFLPNGAIDPTFNVTLPQDPWEIKVQADGKVLLGGSFNSINGFSVEQFVRLNTDGTVDTGFDPPPAIDEGQVRGILPLPDGKILVARPFVPGHGFSRLLSDGSLDPGFETTTSAGGFFDFELLADGRYLAVGIFADLNGSSAASYALVDASGASAGNTAIGPPFNGDDFINACAVDSQGRLVLVGSFNTFGADVRNSIVRVVGCTQQTYYADSDADSFGDPNVSQSACTQPPGYVLNNADCDDTDPLILGPTQWWIDADGDGWGVPPMVLACTQPVGYVSNDIDCDDTDPLITPTEWCVDVDSDGHGDPTNTIWSCDQPLGTVPVGGLCDDCNDDDASIYPGAPCDDGDPNTDDDVYLSDCSCLGTPCTNIQFEVITDAQGADLEWQVNDDDQTTACFGSNFPANTSCLTETCCLPTGDYSAKLRLQNGASNFAGSYIIREGGNGRIVHNPDGFPGTAAKHGIDGRFTMTMGTDRMVESRCDVSSLTSSDFLIAVSNPLVAAEVLPGGWSVQPANTGYVYWIFDPDGGYDQVFFESLRSTNGVTGGQDARARRLRLNSPQVALNPPPNGVVLNIRVAHRINGVTSAFGPACRFMVNGPATPVWQNHLVDLPGDALHSCGITTSFSTSNTNNRVYAVSLAAGANYRFQWTRVAGGPPAVVTITRTSGNTSNNRYMALSNLPSPSWMANWTDPIQPQPGDVWSVRVAHQRFGQSQWSAFGPCCTVTFDAGGSAMIEQPIDQTISLAETVMELWPNPNRDGRVNLVLRGVETKKEVLRITLLDAQGRLAYDRTFANAEPESVTTLDLAGIAPGLYLVRAFVGEQHFTERLVVE